MPARPWSQTLRSNSGRSASGTLGLPSLAADPTGEGLAGLAVASGDADVGQHVDRGPVADPRQRLGAGEARREPPPDLGDVEQDQGEHEREQEPEGEVAAEVAALDRRLL